MDTSESGVAIVVLEGEHELFSAPKLQRQLEALIREGLSLVVDLAEATFLDSSVVAVLLRARDRASEAGVRFAIVVDDSTGEPVRRMFEITGLAAILPVFSSREEALPRASQAREGRAARPSRYCALSSIRTPEGSAFFLPSASEAKLGTNRRHRRCSRRRGLDFRSAAACSRIYAPGRPD